MKDNSDTQFFINHIKSVTPNNIQIHLIIISYNNINEKEIRVPKTNSIDNNSKEMKIEIAMNGHLENCVCGKCHEGRKMLKALRNI